MKKYSVVILCLLLVSCLILMTGCGRKSVTSPPKQETEFVSETGPEETVSQPVIEDQPAEDEPEESPVEEDPVYRIETDYGALFYPEKWESSLRTESVGDNRVAFYGEVGDHGEQHMFDLVFGGEEGDYIGTVGIDGKEVEVNVVFSDIEYDSSWSEEEIAQMRAMREDVNILIDHLGE